MKFFHAQISYDGTNYLGFQKAREGNSIQEELIHAFKKITPDEIQIEAASRTDKGVHARGQSISFSIKKDLSTNTLQKALNAHLPRDIRILNIEEASNDFHPTIDAKMKEYRYYLSTTLFQVPMDRLYAWHVPQKLDIDAMKKASKQWIGAHDFSAFSTKKAQNPICTLYSIDFVESRGSLEIHLKGDRFLYKMARTLVGTLVAVGRGKDHRRAKKREDTGMTAPAHGLFLHRVIY